MNGTAPCACQALTGPPNPPFQASPGHLGKVRPLDGRTAVPSHARDEVTRRARAALDAYQWTHAFESPPAPDHTELATCLNVVLAIVERGMVHLPGTDWWDAEPGDVWVLTVSDRPAAAYTFSDRRWWPVRYPGTALSDPHAITTGYRIWPEGKTP